MLVNVDAAGLTLGALLTATLGGSLLWRVVMSFWRTLVRCCFVVAVTGTGSSMDLRKSVAAMIVRSASKMAGVEKCANYRISHNMAETVSIGHAVLF